MKAVFTLQIIGALFGLIMVYVTEIHYKKEHISKIEKNLWILGWLVIVLLALFPNVINTPVQEVFEFDRRLDFFIVVGLFVALGMLFMMNVSLKRTQKEVQELVKSIAIKRFDNDEKK